MPSRIAYQQLNASLPQLAQQGWIVVDTTALDVEATVATIVQLTASGS